MFIFTFSMTPLRVLCLHGYRQNGTMFREKTGSLRKLLKKHVAEFVYIDAPHLIPNDASNEQEARENERGIFLSRSFVQLHLFSSLSGWWFSAPEQTYDPLATTSCDRGFNESIDFLLKYLAEQSTPFDGLLAFSQGAAFAALLLARLAASGYPFRFVILVAAFQSGQEQHRPMYEHLRIDLPNLHVIGTGDKVIPCQMSEHLAKEYFRDPQIYRHDGGHFVPTTAEAKASYFQFLDRFV